MALRCAVRGGGRRRSGSLLCVCSLVSEQVGDRDDDWDIYWADREWMAEVNTHSHHGLIEVNFRGSYCTSAIITISVGHASAAVSHGCCRPTMLPTIIMHNDGIDSVGNPTIPFAPRPLCPLAHLLFALCPLTPGLRRRAPRVLAARQSLSKRPVTTPRIVW